MKGTVLAVDPKASEAIVSGDDGVRYTFGAGDWRQKGPPVRGQRVDFVTADGQRATEVYVDVVQVPASSGGWAAMPPPGSVTSASAMTGGSPDRGAGVRNHVLPPSPAAHRSLWQQPSFLATVGLCVFVIIGILAIAAGHIAQGPLPREGTCATYEVVDTPGRPITPEMIDQTRAIIESRVRATGVAGPVVYIDDGLLRVGIPVLSPDDEAAQEIRKLIGTIGVLEFMPVPAALQGSVAEGPLPEAMLDVEPLFTGVEIASAAIAQDPTTREIVVDLQLKDTGSRLFDDYAEEHYGEQFAIVLDDQVMSAPVIQATRFGGKAQISGGQGGFPVEEARSLVTVMEFGSLPLEIRETEFGACGSSG